MKDHSNLNTLERAMTFLLLADSEQLGLYYPLLNMHMFAEVANYHFLKHGYELFKTETLSSVNLVRLCSKDVNDAEKHYNLMATSVASSSSFDKHYKLWLDEAKRRFIDNAEKKLKEQALPLNDYIVEKDKILAEVRSLGSISFGLNMSQCINLTLANMKKTRDSKGADILETGFEGLDKYMLGLMPGTLTVVAARPGVGKTSLACQLALRAQSKKFGKVMFNSLEMPADRITIRMAGVYNGVNTHRFIAPYTLTDDEYLESQRLINKLEGMDFEFTQIFEPERIHSAVLALKPKVVFFDYLQILSTPLRYGSNRAEFLGDVTRTFANIALKTNTIFVLLAQLKRTAQNGDAGLEDLKGSGGIEEAADNVIIYERPNKDDEGVDSLKGELTLPKCRYGYSGIKAEVLFNPASQRTSKWDIIEAEKVARVLGID